MNFNQGAAQPPPPPPISPWASPPTPAGEESLRLSWAHPPGMVALSFKNFFLRIITLGIYHFWGKTEVRRRIWSGIRLNGEPMQYTGTGKEMLLGFLFIMGVIFIPVLVLSLLVTATFGPNSPALPAMQGILYVAFFYLIGVGIHRATRYRLSRTRWRGIRGGLEGSAWRYGWTYFWTGALLVLTLGWIAPWRSTRLQSLITNDMRFGNRPLAFQAVAGPLYRPFAVLWVSAIVILGLVGLSLSALFTSLLGMQQMPRPGQSVDPGLLFTIIAIFYGVLIVGFLLFGIVSAWYRARLMNHFAAHTTFEGARFSGTATGRSLLSLTITNYLMVIFTLGLLSPVAQARAARYFVEHLQLEGTAELGAILQRAEDASGRGEGLAQAFDIDAF
jgi:uncharacterized membrane protein YjgN (DUF898 family)